MFCSSCDKDDLDRTIWIPDDTEPGLPAYSEWGYNTYGAYVNDAVLSCYQYSYDKWTHVVTDDATLAISLGYFSLTDGEYDDYSSDYVVFKFPYKRLNDFTDLGDLNDKRFDLTSDGCQVLLKHEMRTNGKGVEVRVTRGYIHIRRVQIVYLDGVLREAILSGVFDVSGVASVNGRDVDINITKGRFDIGVSQSDIVK